VSVEIPLFGENLITKARSAIGSFGYKSRMLPIVTTMFLLETHVLSFNMTLHVELSAHNICAVCLVSPGRWATWSKKVCVPPRPRTAHALLEMINGKMIFCILFGFPSMRPLRAAAHTAIPPLIGALGNRHPNGKKSGHLPIFVLESTKANGIIHTRR